MRIAIATTALVCLGVSTPAWAQSATAVGAGTGIATSRSTAGALAVSGQGGQGGNVTINSSVPATQTINQNVSGTTTSNVNSTVSGSTTQHVVTSGTSTVRTNPAVFAPGLSAAGLETCLGSASGGISLAGFGLTGGSSTVDEGCQARLDARTLASFNLKAAAVARLCQRAQIWQSMPDVCARYTPQVQPAGYPAPVVTSARYAGGPIMLVDGKTGRDRLCSNYAEARQKCLLWADAKPLKIAATESHRPRKAATVPLPTPKPATVAAAPITAEEPKKE